MRPVDKDRIYLAGFSMGGYGTYRWASAHPETFAAIAPVSGAARLEAACSLRSVPIWAFHGAKDETVKLEDDEAGVNAIRACGGDVKLTVYPDMGHSSDAAYADPQLYQWFLAHRRNESLALQIVALRAAREARIKQQIPAANADSTLRRLIGEVAAGHPDYSQMTSALATASRRNVDCSFKKTGELRVRHLIRCLRSWHGLLDPAMYEGKNPARQALPVDIELS